MHFTIRFLAALWALSLAVMAGPANASVVPLYEANCLRGYDTLQQAREADPGALDCSADRYADEADVFRVSASVAQPLRALDDPLLWQTESALFERIDLEFLYADGQTRSVTIDPTHTVEGWYSGTRFSVSVPETGAALSRIDALVVRPWAKATLTHMRVVEAGAAQAQHNRRAQFAALISGLLLATLLFDLFYFRLIRARFLSWHIGLTAALLLYVLANSGLVIEVVPAISAKVRYFLNTFSVALVGVAGVGFLLAVLELRVVSRRMRKAAWIAAAVPIVVKLFCLIGADLVRVYAHSLSLLSLLPVTAITLALLYLAIVRRSNVWPHLTIAWSGMIVAGLIRMASDFDFLRQDHLVDDTMVLSAAMLALGTAAAVARRTLNLRVQRDRARIEALQMGRMAFTDPLTGLGNRRAFDRVMGLRRGEGLLLIDIDHFKAVNDDHGHLTGDKVLIFAARAMQTCFERDKYEARAFRIGGEEFAIVLRAASREDLLAAAECLRGRIEAGPRESSAEIPAVTASIGAAGGMEMRLVEAVKFADAALYEAKNSGRNAVRARYVAKSAAHQSAANDLARAPKTDRTA